MKHFRLFLIILASAVLIVLGSFYFGLEGLVKMNEKFREFRENAFSSHQEPIIIESSTLRGVNQSVTDERITQNFRNVYFQFTNNFNFKTQMHYVGSHVWQVAIRVPESDETFILVAEAESQILFGDEGLDGKVDEDGPDIPIQVPGLYVVRFDERTLDYTVTWRGEDVLEKTAQRFAKETARKEQPVGYPPIARAGSDISIELGQSAYFDASDSTDPDDDITTFQWSNGLNGEIATKVYDQIGSFPVVLTVTDENQNTATDEVMVTVVPRRNGLAIGYEWVSVNINSADGSNQSANMDVTGDHLWSVGVQIPQQSQFLFNTGDTNKHVLGDNDVDGIADLNGLPILVEHGGMYLIQLDDAKRQYRVIVGGNNLAPKANAGVDQTVSVGQTVTLDGRASLDPDGYIASYEWSTGDFVNVVEKTFDQVGTNEIRLTVTDDRGVSSSDMVVIDVIDSDRAAEVSTIQILSVDGGTRLRMSLAADNTWETNWRASASAFWFVIPGQEKIKLGDNEQDGIADKDGRPIDVKQGKQYSVSINDSSFSYQLTEIGEKNIPPVAVLGDDKTIAVNDSVTLDASQSYDEDGFINTYKWDDGQQSAIVTVTFNEPGMFEKTVTVIDDQGAEATATLRVFVKESDAGTSESSFQISVKSDNWQPREMNQIGDAWTLDVSFIGREDQFMFISGQPEVKWGDTSGDGVADRYAPMIPAPDAGYYTITINADTKRYRIENLNEGLKPSANAGADQTVYAGDWVRFDATASIPSTGGQIVRYQWSHGGEGATPSIQYDKAGTFDESVTIHDTVGKTSTDKVTITVLAASQYSSQYKTLTAEFFPQSRASKRSVPMTLTAPNIWQAEVDVNANTGQLMEIHAVGDAESYLGESGIPSTLAVTGEPISIRDPGRYLLEIYDLNLTYSLQYLGESSTRRYNRITIDVLAPDAQPIEMKLIEDHLWQAEILVQPEWQSPKFTLKTGQGQTLGDSNIDGLLDANGQPIEITSAGIWTLDIDDETNAYLLTQESYASQFAQLFIRLGSTSGLPIPMELISDNTWSAIASFDHDNDRFLFDVFGDARLTYGDNNGDRVADESGNLIYINETGTQYEIRFYDNTMRYVIFERPN